MYMIHQLQIFIIFSCTLLCQTRSMEHAPRSITTLVQRHENICIRGDCLDLSHKNLSSIKDIQRLATAIKNRVYFSFLQGDTSSVRALDCSYNALTACSIPLIKTAFPKVHHIILSHNPLKKLDLSGLRCGDTLTLHLDRRIRSVNFEALLYLEPINLFLSKYALSNQQRITLKTINHFLERRNRSTYMAAIGAQIVISTTLALCAYTSGVIPEGTYGTLGALCTALSPLVFHSIRQTKVCSFLTTIYGCAYPSTDQYNGHNITMI